MYSNKENVNILTSLLVAHGVRHAVVCPGSRNAPIVHNLSACQQVACHPVTDERSAGFYALGMAQATAEPVVVCVTSGTALLNVAPAVAEAYYQHLPLIVVSADRPAAWIGQLDGQTLPQPGALGVFVRRTVTLPETGGWHCNRLVNEALLAATADDPRPVHINVPISEPLFDFTLPRLPDTRHLLVATPPRDYSCLLPEFVDSVASARRPMIVFGQATPHDYEGIGVDHLFSHVIVLHEALSPFPSVSHFDEVLSVGGDTLPPPPDVVVHVGDTVVSKRLRHYLRSVKGATTWRLSRTADVEDTFQNLCGIVVGDPEFILQSLDDKLRGRTSAEAQDYRRQWLRALKRASQCAGTFLPRYSQMAAVRCFEQRWQQEDNRQATTVVHYANSTAIRLANIYAAHHVWCNRGVNGIEGSLSAAAGFSVVTAKRVFCVVGDLSFFYDQNALWNQNLRGNLRILLLNNGRGGIFSLLPGLSQSAAHDSLVAAAHHTTAEGICRQNDVGYLRAENMEEMVRGVEALFGHAHRPLLLEVLTDAATDAQVMQEYYRLLST